VGPGVGLVLDESPVVRPRPQAVVATDPSQQDGKRTYVYVNDDPVDGVNATQFSRSEHRWDRPKRTMYGDGAFHPSHSVGKTWVSTDGILSDILI
jgi:hypothetical protein